MSRLRRYTVFKSDGPSLDLATIQEITSSPQAFYGAKYSTELEIGLEDPQTSNS